MKMTEQERIELIKSITEGLATDKTFGEVIRKIKFQEGKIDVNGMTKEEKTIKFFKGLVEKDYATCKALNGTNEPTLVPEEFRAEVISRVEKSNFALINHVFTVPVDKRAGNIPVLDGGMTMKWGSAEGGLNKSNDKQKPHFDKISYVIKNLKAYTVLSEDLLDDTHVVNLFGIIAELYTNAYIKATNMAILNGQGDDQDEPQGIIGELVAGEDATMDDVIAMPFEVPASKRANAFYITNAQGVKELKLMKDANGRYLWNDGNVVAGVPATFNGYKVMELEELQEGILFGNFKDYIIFDRKQMTSTINNTSDTSFYEDVIMMKVKARLDGKVANKKSFTYKKLKAVSSRAAKTK